MAPKTAVGWPWAAMLTLVALAGLSGIALLDNFYRGEVRIQADQHLAQAVGAARDNFRSAMQRRISAVEDLRAFILANPILPGRDAFDRFAASIRSHKPAIRALVYVDRDLTIRQIYPLKGYERALGADLRKRPSIADIRRVIQERQTLVDQPHAIIGGELAIVARAPLFRGGEFLGLAQGVFVITDVVQQDFGTLLESFDIHLRDSRGRVFWSSKETLPKTARTEVVEFGGTAWLLTMAPHQSLIAPSTFVRGTIWLGGLFATLLLLYAVHRTWSHKLGLDSAIAEKTNELKIRNRELESEIFQRKATETSLRRSEARLIEAQRIARVGSWEWDVATGELLWSDELYRIFGVQPGSVQLSYKEYLQRIHPDDRARIEQHVTSSLDQSDNFQQEYRILWPDGSVHYLRGRGKVIRDEQRRPRRMAGIAADITEQKMAQLALQESERKYRVLMENAGDGIIVTTFNGRIVDVNERLLKTLGYSKEELLELTAADLVVPEERADVEAAFERVIRTGRSLAEHTMRRKNGSTYPAEVAGATVQLNGQTVTLGVFRDISVRKQLARALYRYQTELESLVEKRTEELTVANRELEAFSYSVSHDLRGPLRAINGFSQILEEDYGDRLDAAGYAYIEKICLATERMARLIDDLLKLSRTVRAELHWETVDLSAMAQEIADELQATADEREIEVEIQPGLLAVADAVLIRSLLDNLLRNAWKFTRGQRRVEIRFGATEYQGETAFFVQDNGIGLDMADTSKLFEPFHRLHGVDEYEGSGIGLATVQRVVRRHGGRVWVEGEPGKGALFLFTLAHREISPAFRASPLLDTEAG